MGVCTKIWTATAVLILAVSCILARPSGPEATDEQRESRTSNGFKYVTSPHLWAYLTSTYIPQYLHSDISPLLRHETTPPPLNPPSNSWLYHSAAYRHGFGPNNYLTEHRPSFNFGLPLFQMSPQNSDLYIFVNGRSSANKPITKQMKDKSKQASIIPGVHSTQILPNSLSDVRHHTNNGVQKSDVVKNTSLLRSRPSQDEVTNSHSRIFNNNTAAVIPVEVQHNTGPVVTPKMTTQTAPEPTLNVTEKPYDSATLTVTNAHYDEGYLKLLHKRLESLSENSKNKVNASELKKPTTLILKPSAKVVAGPKGIAIAAPVSRAVVRKGQDVSIHFDPEAVAVVGPGGVADAHSDLIVSYYEDITSQKKEKR